MIEERRFLIREAGSAWVNLKLKAKGFEQAPGYQKGPNMGLKAYFCFVADPEYGTKIMACRIPCLC